MLNRLISSISKNISFELRLIYLMPFFLVLGLLISANIANAAALRDRGFAPVAIHPSHYADYSRDPLDLQFAPIDPSIIGAAQQDSAPPADEPAVEGPGEATPVFQPTATPIIVLPTLPGPTIPPLLPTLPPLLPTLPPIVPTLLPIIPTALPIVPTVVAPIIDLIPTVVPCNPILFVLSC